MRGSGDETYQELINYLENEQEIIRYPDRTDNFLRDSPYLTQLDGEGQRTLEEQQLNTMKQQEKERILRDMGYGGKGEGKGGGKGGGKGKRALSRAEREALGDPFDADPDPLADTAAGPMDSTEPLEDLTGVATYPMDRSDDDGVYATDDGDKAVPESIRSQALGFVVSGGGKLLYKGGSLLAKGTWNYGPTAAEYTAYGIGGAWNTVDYLSGLARRGAPRRPIENYEPDLGGSSSSGLERGPVDEVGMEPLPWHLQYRNIERTDVPPARQSLATRANMFLGGRRFRSQEEKNQDARDAYERADLVRFR